jgi:hypothetical protein
MVSNSVYYQNGFVLREIISFASNKNPHIGYHWITWLPLISIELPTENNMVIQQNQVLFNAEKNLDIDVEVLKRMNQQNI